MTVPPPMYVAAVAVPGAPADLGKRFVARLIDFGIILAPACVIGGCANVLDQTGEVGSPSGANPVFTFLSLLWWLGAMLYEFVMLGRTGQTVGKRVMKLRVVSLDGQPLSWGGAALRVYIQAIASSCTCGIGGLLFALSPLFDSSPWKRGWPDQIASSVVVQTD